MEMFLWFVFVEREKNGVVLLREKMEMCFVVEKKSG
jgi:hypothetical protein